MRRGPLLYTLIIGLAIATGSAGCQSLEELEKEVTARVRLKLDPSMSNWDKDLILSDIKAGMEWEIKAESGSPFDQVFGGTGTADVVHYLDERIKYVIPEEADIASYTNADPSEFAPPPVVHGLDYDASVERRRPKMTVMARNWSLKLWTLREHARYWKRDSFTFKFAGKSIPVDSMAVGVLQLGEGYSYFAVSTVVRFLYLTHEARHSDCTGQLTNTDIDRVRRGLPPGRIACGHKHSACDSQHPYAGIDACDSHPFGAYTMQALLADAIANHCNNCGWFDRLEADAALVDAISRVPNYQQKLDASPDMTNSSHPLLREDD